MSSGCCYIEDEPFKKIEGKTFSALIGKKIKQLYIGNDGWTLCFIDEENEQFVFNTQNDCCNDVWFSSINNLELLIGQTVTDCEDKEWHDWKGSIVEEDCNNCVEEAIMFTLSTSKGYVDIEVRNSHNGYYGGRVCYDHKGVVNLAKFKEITQDF